VNSLTKTFATGATLLGLGALAGVAMSPGHGSASTAQKPPPVEVRTQVIARTVRIHRRAKPPRQPPRPVAPPAAPPAPAAAALPSVAPRQVAAQPVAPVTHKPVRTRTSGASGGHSGERDDGHEGHDD
jgi:hypothetical protein